MITRVVMCGGPLDGQELTVAGKPEYIEADTIDAPWGLDRSIAYYVWIGEQRWARS